MHTLKHVLRNKKYWFIDNNNIKVAFLAQDCLHLNKIGKSCFANFINFRNRWILWYEEACNNSDNCLSNAVQENCTDPKENKPVNSENILVVFPQSS